MKQYESRKYVIIAIVAIAIIALIVRLFVIQIASDTYRISASNNAQRHVIQYPPRGIIYDRDSNILASNIAAYDMMVIPSQVQEMDTAELAGHLGITVHDFRQRLAKASSYSLFRPSVFYKLMPAEEYARLQENLYKYPGFFVQSRTIRDYSWKTAAHVLGDVGEVSRKIIKQDTSYKMGDYAGMNGLEKYYEKELRGKKGVKIYLVNARNIIKESFKEGRYDRPAIPGKDLVSTLDMELQLYGERLMKNKIGSVVAIDPNNGEILAMISSPAYDPDLLVGRQRGTNYDSLLKADYRPLFNRAVNSASPPGSTFKPAQAMVALNDGLIEPYSYFPCNKALVGCHNHPSATNVAKAIQYSCNPYFYEVFRRIIQAGESESIFKDSRIGLAKWKEKMTSLGFGQAFDIGLPAVSKGQVPSPDLYDGMYGKYRWAFSTIYSLSIGQGELSVTPLQLANFAAILANRGHYFNPHLVKHIAEDSIANKYRKKVSVPIDTSYYPYIVNGMELAVNGARGTAGRARIKNVIVCGKTGTAENPHGEDHSIFMAFAPKDSAEIAIAVYVENAGFGGTWAAPIASLMMGKYLTDTIQNSWKENRILEADLLPKPDSTENETQ